MTETLEDKEKVRRKDLPLLARVPLVGHLEPHIGKTRDGSLVAVLELAGLSVESSTPDMRRRDAIALNTLLRNIKSPRVALWTHWVKRSISPQIPGEYSNTFAAGLHADYNQRLASRRLFTNRLYLTILYRATAAEKILGGLFRRFDERSAREILEQSAHELGDIVSRATAGLARYQPRVLGIREQNGRKYSEIGRFYAGLLNYKPHDVAVAPYDMGQAIGINRLVFGREVCEIRHPVGTTYVAALGIKEYCADTWPSMWWGLFDLPHEFTLTQCFKMVDKGEGRGLLKLQQRRLTAASDDAVSQVDELEDALDQLSSNAFVLGEHNAALLVYAQTLPQLKAALSDAHAALSDPGLAVVREDLALESQVWANLPGNHKVTPRPSLITSPNFVCFASSYNYPEGKPTGNHWGEAVTMFRTEVETPFWFSPHVGTLGNTGIYGMSGAGKTVLMAFLLSEFQRFGARNIFLDKDRGAHVVIAALGGDYYPLRVGEPTGFNPFSLPLTPAHENYLVDLVKLLVGDPWTHRDAEDVLAAIRQVYTASPENRRLASLPMLLDVTQENGIASRLRQWINQGRHAWVFDNPADTLAFSESITGFDVTEFLESPEIRTPVISYLLYRLEPLINGDRLILWIDEFWKVLDDPYFEKFVKDKLKTIRKRNGFLVTATQSPEDCIKSPISAALLEQNATTLLLANEKANERDYIDGFKCTEAEWGIIDELRMEDRKFLVKQSHGSTLCRLDLAGLDERLAVLSGTEAGNAVFDRIAANNGGQLPNNWIEQFVKEVMQ